MTTKETYIRQRRPLFWSVSDHNLPNISDELLVETILNYGTLEDVRELIQLRHSKPKTYRATTIFP